MTVHVLPLWESRARWESPTTAFIDTTSRSGGWSIGLSPFRLGPVDLYGGRKAEVFENAWQFAKVYKGMVDRFGDPSDYYWEWAIKGWKSHSPHRYPFAKGSKPLYSWWNGRKLNYIEARKVIYGPLYAELVQRTEAWRKLQEIHRRYKRVVLLDFDAYDHHLAGMSLTQVLNKPEKKMGHAFVLAMLLTRDPALEQMELRDA